MIVFHHQSTELTLKNKWLYRVQLFFFFLSAIGRLTDWPLILHNNPIVLTPGLVFDLSHGPCPQSGLVLLGTGVLLECLIFEGVWYANKVPISISVSSDISRGLVNGEPCLLLTFLPIKLSWSSASFTVISPERVVSGLLSTFPAARRHCLWTNQAEAGAQNSDEPAQAAAGWRAFSILWRN